MTQLKNKITAIADFPQKGVIFRDASPLLKDPVASQICINQLSAPFVHDNITAVVGIEARGFIFGALLAQKLGVGFVALRKSGKLPGDTESVAYQLEYGSATLEAQCDAIGETDRILLADDVLATGGTAAAACQLINKLGGSVAGCAFVVELDFLHGRNKLGEGKIHSLLHY